MAARQTAPSTAEGGENAAMSRATSSGSPAGGEVPAPGHYAPPAEDIAARPLPGRLTPGNEDAREDGNSGRHPDGIAGVQARLSMRQARLVSPSARNQASAAWSTRSPCNHARSGPRTPTGGDTPARAPTTGTSRARCRGSSRFVTGRPISGTGSARAMHVAIRSRLRPPRSGRSQGRA
jgi:hypothetical protein